MSIMEDETTQTVDQHIRFLSNTPSVFDSVFDNSSDNITALIAENCSTNRSIASKLRNSFIGSSSHVFQLTVCEITSDDDDVI